MKTNSIYKSPESRQQIVALYDEKLASLGIAFDEQDVETSFGATHVVSLGDPQSPPLIVLHGINAGSPVALEVVKGLATRFRIHGVDTIGQAGKSADVTLPVNDHSYGKWLAEVFDALNIRSAPVIAASYGSFILGQLMKHAPERIERAILVVPIVVVNGSPLQAITQLLLPMNRFMRSHKDADLRAFLSAFYSEVDDFSLRWQRAILEGVRFDTRRPPLLKADDIANFRAPVYVLAVQSDIFAPAEKLEKQAPRVFKTLREIEILPDSKHVPAQKDFAGIEATIARWLDSTD